MNGGILIQNIVFIAVSIITYILGIISKRHNFIKNDLIPIQNLLIGITTAIIYFIFTKNFSYSIAVSGLVAGGTYDILHNLKKIWGDEMIYPILNINITGGYNANHQALDLGWTNTPNEELLACSSGIVEDVYTITTGGNTILINYQNGYKSYFMHCSKIVVNKGDKVNKKQLVAYMGATGTQVTGPHCHFILTLHGTRVNPLEHCYIESWQKVSAKTLKYNVLYKEEQKDIPDSKPSVPEPDEPQKEEPAPDEPQKEEPAPDEPQKEELDNTPIIDDGVVDTNEPKKISIIKRIIEFIYNIIKILIKK